MYEQVLEAVQEIALAQAAPFTEIVFGAMPQDNGLAMYLAPSAVVSRMYDRGGLARVAITLNGKHTDQRVLVAALGRVHTALTKATGYPSGDDWKILGIETAAAPNYVDTENEQYMYSSTLIALVEMKGV